MSEDDRNVRTIHFNDVHVTQTFSYELMGQSENEIFGRKQEIWVDFIYIIIASVPGDKFSVCIQLFCVEILIK